MYVVLDNTFATLGDLIGFDNYLNTTTPFTLAEHQVQWKTDRHYHDFNIGDDYNKTCTYPKFWLETGYPVGDDVTSDMVGCYDSDVCDTIPVVLSGNANHRYSLTSMATPKPSVSFQIGGVSSQNSLPSKTVSVNGMILFARSWETSNVCS